MYVPIIRKGESDCEIAQRKFDITVQTEEGPCVPMMSAGQETQTSIISARADPGLWKGRAQGDVINLIT